MWNRIFRLAALYLILLQGLTAWAQENTCSAEGCGKQTESLGLRTDEFPADITPAVTPLGADPALVGDRMYQRITGPADILAAPAGEVVRTIAPGYTFVTTQGTDGDFTQINPGEWVHSSHLTPVWPSRFSGILFHEPLAYPMGWLLRYVVPSVEPGAEPSDDGISLARYTRVSIFATEVVDDWRWYQIGPNQWIHQTNVAKVLPVERPADVDTERWVSIDLYEQVTIAYEGTEPVFATLISSGLAEWPTNEGLFNVYLRNPRAPMSGANAQPDYYDLEEVPWTMYFDGDIALHGTYWHDGFGYRHSHGCVNLSIADSHWMYQWASPEFDFQTPGDTGIAVYVYSSGIYR